MGENTNGKTKKTPGLGLALLPLAFMFVVLFLGLIIFSIDIKILLLICAAFTIVLCLLLGYTWKDCLLYTSVLYLMLVFFSIHSFFLFSTRQVSP